MPSLYWKRILPKMRELSKTQNLLFRLGAVMMLIGTASFLFAGWAAVAVFGVGVMLFVAMQLNARYDGHNFTIARLRRQQLIGAAMLVVSALAMTYQMLGHNIVRYNEWVVCLMIGAVLQFYTALRIPQVIEKEKR